MKNDIDVLTLSLSKEYTDEHGGGGGGEGDMKKSVYDAMLAVANAGGIPDYVADAIKNKANKTDLPTMGEDGYLKV